MKRIEWKIYTHQWMFIPVVGLIRKTTGLFNYRYRIAFAWLCFYISFGVVKCDKEASHDEM